MTLAIELTFLTGRYVATSYNDRRRAEWPPHPARLFSALAATHFAAEEVDADERAILMWLEGLDAPALAERGASEREVTTVFVPVNDASVVKNFDADAQEVEAARASGAKKLGKLQKALEQSIAQEIAAPKKISKQGPADAMAVLPEHRTRQPRTFPSVSPSDPRCTFIWPNVAPTPEQIRVLDRLLARLVRLGHSSTLVMARLLEAPPPATLVPSELDTHGMRLRATRRGQLAALEEAFLRHQEAEPRVMPARFQPYAPVAAMPEPPEPATVFADDWLVLRRAGGPALPLTAGPGVARALRRVLLSYFGSDTIPEAISGHSQDGKPSGRDHLAIVPLAFVAAPYADGTLLGVALVMPREVADDDRRALYRAVARWEITARKLPENAGHAGGDVPKVPLMLGEIGVWQLQRVEGHAKLTNLRAESWCGPARTWATVTPVALDRNPGDLHARDRDKVVAAIAEATSTVSAACQRIGLPPPTRVEILPAAPFAGAEKARRYPAFSQGADRKNQRVLTHVRLEFEVPVRGPLIIGAGRYRGLGLFRPEQDHG